MTDVRLTALNPVDSQVYPVACNTSGELLVADGGPDLTVTGNLTVDGTASFNNDDVNIDSSGRLLVGATSGTTEVAAKFQARAGTAAAQGTIMLSRGAANPTSAQTIGEILFTDLNEGQGAKIQAVPEANWASNDYPCRLAFFTTPDNASSPTERLRINSNGNVGIGTTSVSANLHVKSSGATEIRSESTGDNAIVAIKNSSSAPWLLTQRSDTSNGFSFRYNGNNYVNIDSSGRLLVGTTTKGQPDADNFTVEDSGNCGISIRSGTTNNGNIFFSDATSGSAEYRGAIRYYHNDDALTFWASSSERMRITNAGDIYIGGNSSTNADIILNANGTATFLGDITAPNINQLANAITELRAKVSVLEQQQQSS